jgi:hypothetical protein
MGLRLGQDDDGLAGRVGLQMDNRPAEANPRTHALEVWPLLFLFSLVSHLYISIF